MDARKKITATIVLYKPEISSLEKTIKNFLDTPLNKKLYLIDNSPTKRLENNFKHPDIEYFHNGKNVGFGKGHNKVLKNIKSDYHLILNPDVEFESSIIPTLISSIENKKELVFVSPKVIYPNNNHQYICRKHPTFLDLINRKLKLSKKILFKNEYRNIDLSKPFFPDFIHGCFMLFKTDEFIKLKGFDERYFLYMEDADICREIDKFGKKKLYYPLVTIIHQHQKGSSKSLKLFSYHFSSAIKYFLKWGF